MASSRWLLILKACLIRGLGKLLLPLINFLTRKASYPSTFSRKIPTTISPLRGNILLEFYTPQDYYQTRNKTSFPAIINFHGGGFCLGSAIDDAPWAKVLVEECNAVIISVNYRLAPEYPFPTAVEDGADALLYVVAHADELGIDIDRIATSGFSAGGNLCITVPLLFQEILQKRGQEPVDLKAIAAWYPSTDFTRSRADRVATMVRPDKQLPRFLTRLFDEGYVHPADVDRSGPYLSPFVTSKDILARLPKNFILYTCEWDMLEKEGTEFARRLEEEIGKHVKVKMVKGVPHGWDKYPNASPAPESFYSEACVYLNRAFEGGDVSGQ